MSSLSKQKKRCSKPGGVLSLTLILTSLSATISGGLTYPICSLEQASPAQRTLRSSEGARVSSPNTVPKLRTHIVADDKAVPRPVKLKVGVALIVDTKDIVFSGRVQLDTYAFFLKERSDLKKKSLGFLGSSLLGPDYDKEDIQISEINDLQDGDENTRRRIAVYCFKVCLEKLHQCLTFYRWNSYFLRRMSICLCRFSIVSLV